MNYNEASNIFHKGLMGYGICSLLVSIPLDSVPLAISGTTALGIKMTYEGFNIAERYLDRKINLMKKIENSNLKKSELESKVESN